MDDRGTDPFDDLEGLFEEMSRRFGGAAGLAGDTSVPIDLREEERRFVLEADLPGFDPDAIDLRVSEGRQVTIEAQRETASEAEAGRFITRERRQESISRSVTLPDPVDETGTEAAYDAGVLTVSLPKRTADEDDGTDIPVR